MTGFPHRLLLAAGLLTLGWLACVPAARAYTQLYRFQYCVGISSDKERLACYDNYARDLGLRPAGTAGISATQTRHGMWTVRTESLPVEGKSTVFVFGEGKGNLFGIDGKPVLPTLIARCGADVTELYLAFSSGMPTQLGPSDHSVFYYRNREEEKNPAELNEAAGGDDWVSARIRLDDAPPVDVLLKRSVGGLGYFFPNPVSYLSQMRRHDRMEFVYRPPGHADVAVQFPLAGLDEALKPLREACSW